MKLPLETTFRGIQKTPDLQSLIESKAKRLQRYCESIISCRVVVENPHKHQQTGQPFRVRLDIKLPPGHEVVVNRLSTEGDIHNELQAVLRDAFDAAVRKIKRTHEKQRGKIKRHPAQETSAMVTKIFPELGYGFIRSLDGREIYFHKNCVRNHNFERLRIGAGVKFEEIPGEKGPQATTVQIVDQGG